MVKQKTKDRTWVDNILSCSCFGGSGGGGHGKAGIQKQPSQLVNPTNTTLAPLPIQHKDTPERQEITKQKSNSFHRKTPTPQDQERLEAQEKRQEQKYLKEQKRKERFDTKQKRLAEEDMKNSPFAQEIEAEEKAEKKAVPGWDGDPEMVSAVGQTEILEGEKLGGSPARSKLRGTTTTTNATPTTTPTSTKSKKKKGSKK